MGTAIKHPVPDRVKPSFVIFDIRILRHSELSVRVPGCQKLQMTTDLRGLAQDVYSCTHMVIVGIKGLTCNCLVLLHSWHCLINSDWIHPAFDIKYGFTLSQFCTKAPSSSFTGKTAVSLLVILCGKRFFYSNCI